MRNTKLHGRMREELDLRQPVGDPVLVFVEIFRNCRVSKLLGPDEAKFVSILGGDIVTCQHVVNVPLAPSNFTAERDVHNGLVRFFRRVEPLAQRLIDVVETCECVALVDTDEGTGYNEIGRQMNRLLETPERSAEHNAVLEGLQERVERFHVSETLVHAQGNLHGVRTYADAAGTAATRGITLGRQRIGEQEWEVERQTTVHDDG